MEVKCGGGCALFVGRVRLLFIEGAAMLFFIAKPPAFPE